MYSTPLPELPARSVSGLAAWETAEQDKVLQLSRSSSTAFTGSVMTGRNTLMTSPLCVKGSTALDITGCHLALCWSSFEKFELHLQLS